MLSLAVAGAAGLDAFMLACSLLRSDAMNVSDRPPVAAPGPAARTGAEARGARARAEQPVSRVTSRVNRIFIEIDDTSDKATDAMFNALHAGLNASDYKAEADGPYVVRAVQPAITFGSLDLDALPRALVRGGHVFRAVRLALRNAGYDVA